MLGKLILGFALALPLAACSQGAENTAADDSALHASVTTTANLRNLVQKGFVTFDDTTSLAHGTVIDAQSSDGLGVHDTDDLVRIADGAVFQRLTVNGPTGDGDGSFADERHFLVLDGPGIAHLQAHGVTTRVRGDRLEQLQQVFARTPHPSDPSVPLWGENPFFVLSNGVEAVAFIGAVYVNSPNGIQKISLSSDNEDSLDQ